MKKCLVCRQLVSSNMENCEPCRGAKPIYSQFHKFEPIEVKNKFKKYNPEDYILKHKNILTKNQIVTILNKTKDDKYCLTQNFYSRNVPILLEISSNQIFAIRKSGTLSYICKR